MKYLLIIIMFCTNIGYGADMSKIQLKMRKAYKDFKIISKCGFIVTSGHRSVSHNKAVGGVPSSFHLKGLAMDLVPLKTCPKSYKELSRIASKLFSGVIRCHDHIHIDLGNRVYHKL